MNKCKFQVEKNIYLLIFFFFSFDESLALSAKAVEYTDCLPLAFNEATPVGCEWRPVMDPDDWAVRDAVIEVVYATLPS